MIMGNVAAVAGVGVGIAVFQVCYHFLQGDQTELIFAHWEFF
jgi:hypothetical protein